MAAMLHYRIVTSFRLFSIVFFTLFFSSSVSGAADLKNCLAKDAINSPRHALQNAHHTFQLSFSSPPEGELSTARSAYLNIVSYDTQTKKKVSAMRLGYGCSNGVGVCRASAYYGQYNSNQQLKNIKATLTFEVLFLSEDFQKADFSLDLPAPYAVILPNTAAAYRYNSPADISEYTTFYDANRIIPDFSGSDVWILSSCGRE